MPVKKTPLSPVFAPTDGVAGKTASSIPVASDLFDQFQSIANRPNDHGIIDIDSKKGKLYTIHGRAYSIQAQAMDMLCKITGAPMPSQTRNQKIMRRFRSAIQQRFQSVGTKVFDERFADTERWKNVALNGKHIAWVIAGIHERLHIANRQYLHQSYFHAGNGQFTVTLKHMLCQAILPDRVTDPDIIRRETQWIETLANNGPWRRKWTKAFLRRYHHRQKDNQTLLQEADIRPIISKTVADIPELANIVLLYRYHPKIIGSRFFNTAIRLFPARPNIGQERLELDGADMIFAAIERVFTLKSGHFHGFLKRADIEPIIHDVLLLGAHHHSHIDDGMPGSPPKTGQKRQWVSVEEIVKRNHTLLMKHHPRVSLYHFGRLLERSSAWPPQGKQLRLQDILDRKNTIIDRLSERYADKIFHAMHRYIPDRTDAPRQITEQDITDIIGKASRPYLERIITDIEQPRNTTQPIAADT